MAEAGLILSVASLTFQVFSGCVQGYQLITDATNMPKEFQYLRVRLKTEQYRLLDWAHVVQLDERDERLLISNASKGNLLDVLDQQNRLLQAFGKVDEKYRKLRKPLLIDAEELTGELPNPPPYSPATSPLERTTPNGFHRVDSEFQSRFPQSEALMKKALGWARQSRTFPKRLAWASWDKTKVEQLILKLTAFNDFMREMLNTSQLHLLAVKQTRTEFQIMQLNGKIEQLVQIFESALSLKSSRSRAPTDPLRAFLQARGLADKDEEMATEPGMHNLAFLAQIKALNSAIHSGTLTDEFTKDLGLGHSASEIRSVELDITHIKIIDPEPLEDGESQRVEAFYHPPAQKKRQVWVEWKAYDPHVFHVGPDDKVHSRVKALAALLKENNRTDAFRAPHCLGYFRDIDLDGEDHCRFGLVFEKPAGVHQATRPISLLDLLRDKDAEMPSLTDRIALACKIAECIERLHAVNWLHKGLRSENILFFSDTGGADVDLALPYLSGFDYSRPAQNEDMTEKPPENAASDLYRHPRVQGSGNRETASLGGFKKSYDLYSLGVILLEIAYWRPIDQVLDIDLPAARPSTTIKVRGRLMDEGEGFLRHVRSHLGNTMHAVVRSCLEGPVAFGLREGDDEKLVDVGAELQRQFYENVVKQLGDMNV
jgi:hypothetical protein